MERESRSNASVVWCGIFLENMLCLSGAGVVVARREVCCPHIRKWVETKLLECEYAMLSIKSSKTDKPLAHYKAQEAKSSIIKGVIKQPPVRLNECLPGSKNILLLLAPTAYHQAQAPFHLPSFAILPYYPQVLSPQPQFSRAHSAALKSTSQSLSYPLQAGRPTVGIGARIMAVECVQPGPFTCSNVIFAVMMILRRPLFAGERSVEYRLLEEWAERT